MVAEPPPERADVGRLDEASSWPSFESILAADRAQIHPFRDLSTPALELDVYVRGEGCYLYDMGGRKFFDAMGGIWCVNIGYGRAEMADAIAAQIKQLSYGSTFWDKTTIPATQLAQRLAQLAPPGLNHVVFAQGGSTGVESAVRLAHYYFQRLGQHRKKKIIAFKEAYHGGTLLASTLTGYEHNRTAFHVIDDLVDHIPTPNVYRRAEGLSELEFRDACVAELEQKIVELGPENVACFIMEPVLGTAGCVVPPPGYHQRAAKVCAKYDVLYVADEVVTAFGRLGEFFASEAAFGVVPDILICAKGLTSGYIPLSATLFRDELWEVMSSPARGESVFGHGFTYSGHPVACAAALTNIDIIEREGICAHVKTVGALLERELAGLSDCSIVGDVRGSHLMMALELVADKDTKQSFAPSASVDKRIEAECKQRGLIVRPHRNPGDLIVLSPPLVMTEGEAKWMVDVLRESIEAAASAIVEEQSVPV